MRNYLNLTFNVQTNNIHQYTKAIINTTKYGIFAMLVAISLILSKISVVVYMLWFQTDVVSINNETVVAKINLSCIPELRSSKKEVLLSLANTSTMAVKSLLLIQNRNIYIAQN